MTTSPVVAGLDLGSGKVAAVVGECGPDGHINILGLGECPSFGIRRGTVVDIDGTARSIEEALNRALRMAGVTIDAVYVTISGADIRSVNNRGVVAVSNRDREIGEHDVARVLEAARVTNIAPDREILHVLPREFSVDGYKEIVDPVGMTGTRLEVETHVVTALNSCWHNVVKSVQKAGLRLEQLVLCPLASAEAVLRSEERKQGTLLIDLGAGTTGIALYEGGGLWFSAVIPVGGDHISKDLSFGLRTPLEEADKIKRRNGLVLASQAPDNEHIEVTTIGGEEKRQVSLKTVASIIEPRVVEIFDLVKESYTGSGYQGLLAGGMVITGGVSDMPGIVDLASERLNLPVRIGRPLNIGGLSDIAGNPRYAAAVGLLRYGSRYCREAAVTEFAMPGTLNKMLSWVRKVFPL